MLEEFRILCGNESPYQLLGDLLVGNGDPVIHHELPDHLIFFGVNDGIGALASLLEGCKIRQVMGVVEKEQGPANEKEKGRKDKGVDDIERPSLFPSFVSMILLFHKKE